MVQLVSASEQAYKGGHVLDFQHPQGGEVETEGSLGLAGQLV